ncbi:MAG TPA: peptidoglycan-binding domain-containing protein [Candidatus Dormibacteraeota bacterium]|nr:peptidoglycan-binding domain-containing protein [Candidatus Dormibacteraeota bacterium]
MAGLVGGIPGVLVADAEDKGLTMGAAVPVEPLPKPPGKPRLKRGWIAFALMVIAAAGTAGMAMSRTGHTTGASQAAATGTARVVRTDLVTTQQVSGIIGYGPTTTLFAPTAATQAAVAQAQSNINSAIAKLAADQAALRDLAAANSAALAVDQATLSADQAKKDSDCAVSASSQQCAQDGQKVSIDQAQLASTQAHNQQTLGQAQAAVNQDQTALANAQAQAAPVQTTAGSGGTSYTGLPAVGAVVSQGQTLYSVDGRPVPLLYGSQAAYRVMTIGVSGTDVQQLEQDLIALGFASSTNLVADGNFTGADAAAVKRWQAALGVPQTGTVRLGDVIFRPAAVRITALHVGPGSPVSAGGQIMDVTSASKVVTIPLNPALGYQVKQGDAVTIDLPDGHTRAPGTVSSVSTVATQQSGNTMQNPNGAPQTTLNVTVTPSDPNAIPNLDQAPVTVDITTQSARNVLAVPVNALLALSGGGYGVEVVDPNDQHRLVTVQTGIFDSSRVEVRGQGLSEGMTVVVPAS